MSVFRRVFGLPMTARPEREGCWTVVDGEARVTLSQAPELQQPGGALRLEGENLPQRLLVVHGVDDVFYCYENNCACSGWRVDPVPGEPLVRCCTLGSSTYDYQGQRVSGPAEKNLTTLPVELREDTLVISLNQEAGPPG